ncbi:hypothetical protein PMAYCL1PPCAC_04703 [Pristionchus mayeri]|uniref:Uncharacterized protein n=1 Tax=Pristionchus mayeri TaxID=1317129 RepID=A0AAN4Z552_9BILA|nr:hypothetical protein PMAYCL1PPCAC_04703 [Pristionchus mayeri]
MTSVEVKNDLHNELQTAYRSARAVYNQFRNVPPQKISIDDRFAKYMSLVVVEAIDAVESNTRMSDSWYDKLSLYVAPDHRIPLLQLGYSLSVLIAKLMVDRKVDEPNTDKPKAPHTSIFNKYDAAIRAIVSDSQPSTSEASTLIGEGQDALFESSEMIKEEKYEEIKDQRSDIEIKEEIKEEPFDDYVEVKHEPLEAHADVFSPTTGHSRPADATTSDCRPIHQIATPSQPPRFMKRTLTRAHVVASFANDAEEAKRRREEEEFQQDLAALPQLPVRKMLTTAHSSGSRPTIFQPITAPTIQLKPEKLKPQKCYLCGVYTTNYDSTWTYLNCRKTFLSRVNITNQRQKTLMIALRASRQHAFFCLSHIEPLVPVQVKHYQSVRSNRPIDSIVQDSLLQRVQQHPVAQRPEDNVVFIGTQKCDLCDDPELPCRLSPTNQTEAQRFFASVDARTSQQADYIQHCITSNEQATICMKHFPKPKPRPAVRTEPPRPQRTYDVVKSTLDLVKQRMVLRTAAGKTIEVFPNLATPPSKQPLYKFSPAAAKKKKGKVDEADQAVEKETNTMEQTDHPSTSGLP